MKAQKALSGLVTATTPELTKGSSIVKEAPALTQSATKAQSFKTSPTPTSSTDWRKAVDAAVAHNQENPARQSFQMSYHKKSTKRVVKRKIDPLRINGNLLLAFDHKRKALRTFHLDGVRAMEKTARGFLSHLGIGRTDQEKEEDHRKGQAVMLGHVAGKLSRPLAMPRVKSSIGGGGPPPPPPPPPAGGAMKVASAFWDGFGKAAGWFGKKKEEVAPVIPSGVVKTIMPHYKKTEKARKLHIAGKIGADEYYYRAMPYTMAVNRAEAETGIPNHHIYNHFNTAYGEE